MTNGPGGLEFLYHRLAMPFRWMCVWPPSPALQACFSEAALDPGASAAEPTVEGFGYKAYASQSWVRLGAPEGPRPEDKDVRATLFLEGLRECAGVARRAGWSGDGRVFVRVTREGEDRTLVQALPLDDKSNDPGLLCCLLPPPHHPRAILLLHGVAVPIDLVQPPVVLVLPIGAGQRGKGGCPPPARRAPRSSGKEEAM